MSRPITPYGDRHARSALDGALQLVRAFHGEARVSMALPGRKSAFRKGHLDTGLSREDEVAAAWTTRKCANPLLIAGRGVIVLDVDVKYGGPETLRDLIAEHGALPPTLTWRTGSGGNQRVYRVDGNPQSQKLAPGVETRGSRSYGLAFGSYTEPLEREGLDGETLGDGWYRLFPGSERHGVAWLPAAWTALANQSSPGTGGCVGGGDYARDDARSYIVRLLGPPDPRTGRWRCPRHDDATPSLRAPAGGGWMCPVCRASGRERQLAAWILGIGEHGHDGWRVDVGNLHPNEKRMLDALLCDAGVEL